LTKGFLNFVRHGLIAAALVCAGLQAPAYAQTAPITGVPSMKDFPGANELPDPSLDYKIVFDVGTMAESPDQVSPALKMIGALINTYEQHGVSPSHLHLQAVFHGPTIALVVDDATYKGRTGVDHNPNVDLLRQLQKAGLKMVVCGQSAMAQHYDFKSILPLAQVNLSASVTFINLMTRGYIKMNE
jgi:intracellular sulfur oxidation DsrE/DsrF family protein